MSIVSAIVKIRDGTFETALVSLAKISQISIYGIKDNLIVAVVEGDNLTIVNDVMNALSLLDDIISVYPVYVVDDNVTG